ncbi:hypothetical protein BDF22DRAFT_703091 [Syncephalis plumigaleata]|nr:hypothetical protein BDF22DRAFT_703091 [Syncephalis plumigaleata]
MAEEVKSANFNTSFHQLPSVIASFDANRDAIAVPSAFAGITGAQLASLTVELLRANERLFGQQANATNQYGPKLPVHLLDASKLTRDAPLVRLLHETLAFCAAKTGSIYNSQVDDLLALFAHLRSVAINAGWWRVPRVTFDSTLSPELQQKLAQLVQTLGGELTTNPQDATHIVLPNPESAGEADQEWYRVVDRRDGMVRVHWGYYPDSYDSWLSESDDVKGDAEPEPVITPPRPVLFRWVEDSVKYREWMNEEDYEPVGSTAVSRQPTHQTVMSKRLAGELDQDSPDKRPRHDMDGVSVENATPRAEELGAAGPELEPLTSGHQLNASHTVTMSVQNASTTDAANTNTTDTAAAKNATTDMAVSDNEPMAQVKEEGENAMNVDANVDAAAAAAPVKKQYTDEDARRFLSQQTHEVIQALPEFFNNKNRSKTPTVYKDYRDFMINTNRLNPTEYLTVTACRRNLAGDVCTIMRVHAFLEQWGLINYQVDAETRPSLVAPPFTGHFRVTVDTPRGLQPFLPAAKPGASKTGQVPPATPKLGENEANATPSAAGCYAATPSTSHLTGGNMDLRKNIYDAQASTADNAKPTTNGAETKIATKYHCSTCGVDCTTLRYHHMKNKLFDVCANCYRDGRFPSNMFSDTTILEALDMFEDDWNRISDHVRTKSREQCILHFLQLPIEEPFLGSREADLGHCKQRFKETKDADGDTAMGEDDEKQATEQTTAGDRPVDQSTLAKAASTALGAAAAKAKVLSEYEEREVQKLVYAVVEAQMKKLELKMNQLEELEQLLEQERQELDRERQQILSERLLLRSATLALSNTNSKQSNDGAEATATATTTAMNTDTDHISATVPVAPVVPVTENTTVTTMTAPEVVANVPSSNPVIDNIMTTTTTTTESSQVMDTMMDTSITEATATTTTTSATTTTTTSTTTSTTATSNAMTE